MKLEGITIGVRIQEKERKEAIKKNRGESTGKGDLKSGKEIRKSR